MLARPIFDEDFREDEETGDALELGDNDLLEDDEDED